MPQVCGRTDAMKTNSATLIFQYWDKLRGDRAAPERGELEPGAVRHALLDTFILENSPDGLLFRLAGTRVCALAGRELRDQPFLSLWSEASTRVELSRMFDAVMDECAGAVAGIRIETSGGEACELELLALPLRHRGRTHARVMGTLAPVSATPWLGFSHMTESSIRSMRIIWPSGLPRAASAASRRLRFQVLQGGKS
jgi:hypothetical protein